MTTIQPGEFWLAEIPFTDGSASKIRPVLVLWLDGSDAVVSAVTSASARSKTDVPLRDWQKSGLRFPSVVRLSRLDCLEQSLLKVRLGKIVQSDAKNVTNAWSRYIKPKF
jgi:mRNA interferase MazF